MNRLMKVALAAVAALALPLAVAAQAPPPDAQQAEQAAEPWMGRGAGFGAGGPGGGMWMEQGRQGRGMGPGGGMWMEQGRQGRGTRGRMGGQMRGRAGRGMGLGILERDAALRERLNVTDQQLERLRALRTEHQQARIRQQAELRIKRMELAEQLRSGEPDRARVERLMRETNDMQFAQRKAAMDHLFTARDVFTAEQRAEMRRLAQERAAEMRQRRLERRGPGYGPGRPRSPRGPAPQGPPPTE